MLRSALLCLVSCFDLLKVLLCAPFRLVDWGFALI
nr:MAG TPA: hypothetical protein [Caudoviricetes sp.]